MSQEQDPSAILGSSTINTLDFLLKGSSNGRKNQRVTDLSVCL